MGIWTVALTIIAMYFAGFETARLAGFSTRHDGLVHGLMMFDLTFVSITGLSLAGTVHEYVATATAQVIWGPRPELGRGMDCFSRPLSWPLAAIGGVLPACSATNWNCSRLHPSARQPKRNCGPDRTVAPFADSSVGSGKSSNQARDGASAPF